MKCKFCGGIKNVVEFPLKGKPGVRVCHGCLDRTEPPAGCIRVDFPKGPSLFYNDEDHSYWRCKPDGERSTRLTGHSSVVKPLDFEPDNLMRWSSKLTLEGVCRAYGGKDLPDDPYVLRMRLEALALNWEAIRDDAADRGTNVHKDILHALATDGEIDLGSIPGEQRGYGQAVMKWWLDKEPEVLNAEAFVYNEPIGVAGQLDLRCRTNDREGVGVVDLKTSGFIPNKHHAQVVGYDVSSVECGIADERADWLMILQVDEFGDYTEVDVEANDQQFLRTVATYRDANDIGREAAKARKARLAAVEDDLAAAA